MSIYLWAFIVHYLITLVAVRFKGHWRWDYAVIGISVQAALEHIFSMQGNYAACGLVFAMCATTFLSAHSTSYGWMISFVSAVMTVIAGMAVTGALPVDYGRGISVNYHNYVSALMHVQLIILWGGVMWDARWKRLFYN